MSKDLDPKAKTKYGKFRADVREDDELCYVNRDYIIYKKNALGMGALDAPIDITLIGLYGLPEYLAMFAETDAKMRVLDRLHEELSQIADKILGER